MTKNTVVVVLGKCGLLAAWFLRFNVIYVGQEFHVMEYNGVSVHHPIMCENTAVKREKRNRFFIFLVCFRVFVVRSISSNH